MNRIYLEYKDVSGSIEPLGIPLAGHLYLARRDDAAPLDTEVDQVIRGGPVSGNLQVIAGASLGSTLDDCDDDESPATRGSYDITDLMPGGLGMGCHGGLCRRHRNEQQHL